MYSIIVKTQYQGFHRYKDAPEEVSFLRDFHRHLFNVSVEIRTTHANRDVEFFIIKSKLDGYLNLCYRDLYVEESCEQIAENIYNALEKHKLEVLRVEVGEDNENIGTYERTR